MVKDDDWVVRCYCGTNPEALVAEITVDSRHAESLRELRMAREVSPGVLRLDDTLNPEDVEVARHEHVARVWPSGRPEDRIEVIGPDAVGLYARIYAELAGVPGPECAAEVYHRGRRLLYVSGSRYHVKTCFEALARG